MKRKYFYLMALAALTLGSCSNENDLFGDDPNGGPQGQQQVTFLFPGTAQGVVPYAGEAIASAEENKIATLDIYVFGRDKLDVTEPYAYLLEDVINLEDGQLTEVGDAMQASLTVRGTNPKVLYFVANGRSHTSLDDYELNVTDTLSFIRKQTTSLGTGLLKAPLLMTGRYTFPTTVVDGKDVIDLTGPHAIALNRRVARFDIINDDKGSTFNIKEIFIKNTRPGAYLFAHADQLADKAVADGTPADFPAYDLPLIEQLMPLDFLQFLTANVGTTPSAFYVYPTEVNGETYFHLSGFSTQSNSQMVQLVKMRKKQTSTTPDDPDLALLPINPNFRYIINVLDAGSATINATLSVEEWKVGQQIDQEAGFGWLKMQLTAPLEGVELKESKLLTVPNTTVEKFDIAVTADTEWEIVEKDADLKWMAITNRPATQPAEVGKKFTLAITEKNPSSEVRKQVLHLRNVKRPSIVQALTVVQAASADGFSVKGDKFENNTLMAMAAGGKHTLTVNMPDGTNEFSCETTEGWITLAQPAPATRAAVPVTGSKLEVTLTANEEQKDGKAVERTGTFKITVGEATQTITVKQAPKNLGSIVVEADGLTDNTVTYPGAAKTGCSLLVRAQTEWDVKAFDLDLLGEPTTTASTWITDGATITITGKNPLAAYSGAYNFNLPANPSFDARKSRMTLFNKFDPTNKLELTIIQKGKLETLSLTGGAAFANDVLTLAADATAAIDLTATSDNNGVNTGTLTTTGVPGWMTVEVTGAILKVTPTANTTPTERTAKITVKMTGANDKEFTVKQAGKAIPPYSITAPDLTFGGEGQTLTLAVPHTGLAKTTMTIDGLENVFDTNYSQSEGTSRWLSFGTSALDLPDMNLTISANGTGAERKSTLTIFSSNEVTAGKAPLTIEVTQAANLVPGPPVFTISGGAGLTGTAPALALDLEHGQHIGIGFTVVVQGEGATVAGLTLEKQADATWLTLLDEEALTTDGIFGLSITQNSETEARTATITVTLEGADAPTVITVTQATPF